MTDGPCMTEMKDITDAEASVFLYSNGGIMYNEAVEINFDLKEAQNNILEKYPEWRELMDLVEFKNIPEVNPDTARPPAEGQETRPGALGSSLHRSRQRAFDSRRFRAAGERHAA